MNAPEVTVTVHPRPVSDDPKRMVVAMFPDTTDPASARVEDRREWDTVLGTPHFLFRYALGRH